MIKKLPLLLGCIALSINSFSQEVVETFTDTRIVNGHSVETLKKRELQYRIEHRFGDFAGPNGGGSTGFGFDNVADIRFALEYGITDKLMVGFARNKGAGEPWKGLLDGFVKYRVLQQDDKTPISLAVIGTNTTTYAKSSPDISSLSHYDKFAHRMAYSTQINVARKFGSRFSLALMPTFVYRNLVAQDDVNGLFSLGGAFGYRFYKAFGVTVEYYHNFNEPDIRKQYFNSIALGLEWNTNGHRFHFFATNSKGFNDTQFIPYTSSDWRKGGFRIGFSISRAFKI